MSALRKLLLVVCLALIVCVAAVFAYNNPEPINVDIGLIRFEGISLTLALACAFALGWLFGLVSVGFAVLRVRGERRRMRRELADAQSEVASLRAAPLKDAD